jgi:hypothetical protein
LQFLGSPTVRSPGQSDRRASGGAQGCVGWRRCLQHVARMSKWYRRRPTCRHRQQAVFVSVESRCDCGGCPRSRSAGSGNLAERSASGVSVPHCSVGGWMVASSVAGGTCSGGSLRHPVRCRPPSLGAVAPVDAARRTLDPRDFSGTFSSVGGASEGLSDVQARKAPTELKDGNPQVRAYVISTR